MSGRRGVRNRSAHPGAPAWLAVLLVGVLPGCFSYFPAELEVVPVGEDVRLELTRLAWAELPEDIPVRDGTRLRGTLVSSNDTELLVRVPIAVAFEGFLARSVGQDVRIAANQVLRLERRELNRTRTGLAVAGGFIAAGVVFASFRESEPESPEVPETEEDEEAGINPMGRVRIPFLSFRFR